MRRRDTNRFKSALAVLGTVDCSYGVIHARSHKPHPVTGRLVCAICHPVPRASRRKQAA